MHTYKCVSLFVSLNTILGIWRISLYRKLLKSPRNDEKKLFSILVPRDHDPSGLRQGIESSGWFQIRKSVNHGLPALLRKLRSLKQKWLPTVTKMHLNCDCAYFGTGQSSRSLPAEGSWALGTRMFI